MSHHGNDPEKIANLVKINTYHVSLFAKFLDKLATTPDGDGSLLDHSMILYGSGMSESNNHSRLDIPTLLVGGTGKGHIKAPKQTPFANLLLDIGEQVRRSDTRPSASAPDASKYELLIMPAAPRLLRAATARQRWLESTCASQDLPRLLPSRDCEGAVT